MKKIYLRLLIAAVLCAIVSMLLLYLTIHYTSIEPFSTTRHVVNETIGSGDTNPGAGEYFLIAGGLSLLADFSILFYLIILFFLIPGFIFLVIVISQLVAFLFQLGDAKEWKNKTSKVFTYISMVLEIILCVYHLCMLLASIVYNIIFLILSLVINILCAYLFIKTLRSLKKMPVESME